MGLVLKVITSPTIPTPLASRKVAVAVAEKPVEIEFVDRAMASVGAGVVGVGVVALVGVPSPQPVSTASTVTSKNDADGFTIFFWKNEFCTRTP